MTILCNLSIKISSLIIYHIYNNYIISYCYPWPLLGIPPAWYKSDAYRARAVREPRRVLAEFGVSLPDSTAIRVWDSTAEIRYLVLPMRPSETMGLGEAALCDWISRDCMIGTGLPQAPK